MGRLAKKVRRLTEKQKATVESNMRLVYSVANRSKCVHLPADDRDQEGMLALINSVKLRRKGGARLSTYATTAIKNRILMAEQQDSLIHVPVYLYSGKFADSRLQDDAQRAAKHEPIDRVWHDDPRHPPEPEDDEPEFGWKAIRAVRWAVQKLPPIERDVIRGLMFRGETAKQLGQKHGVRIADVNRYKKSALVKLRVSLAKHV